MITEPFKLSQNPSGFLQKPSRKSQYFNQFIGSNGNHIEVVLLYTLSDNYSVSPIYSKNFFFLPISYTYSSAPCKYMLLISKYKANWIPCLYIKERNQWIDFCTTLTQTSESHIWMLPPILIFPDAVWYHISWNKGFLQFCRVWWKKVTDYVNFKNGSMFSMIQLSDHSDSPGNKQKILTQYL